MVEVGARAGTQRVGRYRRIVALAVFVASTVALLATSYSPVQSTLVATHQGAVDLTADTPRATGRVRLDLSAEALPEADPPLRTVGEVRFSTRDTDDVALAVTAVGHDAVPTGGFDGLTFPIGQVCRVAEPCEVEFEVVLELTSHEQDLRPAASFVAELEIIYEEVEHNPDGASASWTETSALMSEPDTALETAATDPERITLDEGAFAVSRHVLVGASEAARGGTTSVVVNADATRPTPGRVLVTVQLDGPGQVAVGAGEPIDPFADCPSNDRCEHGLTVTFQLIGERHEQPATFEWNAEVRAVFPTAEAVPAGAAVDVAIDSATEVTETTPRLIEGLGGSFALDGADDQASGVETTTVTLRIDVSVGALPARGFAGMPATSLATLALRSETEGSVQVVVVGGDAGESVGTVEYGPDRSGEVVFNPLGTCMLARACVREVMLSITPLGAADDAAEVTWGIDLEIAYPGLDEVPLGANVDLFVDPPTR